VESYAFAGLAIRLAGDHITGCAAAQSEPPLSVNHIFTSSHHGFSVMSSSPCGSRLGRSVPGHLGPLALSGQLLIEDDLFASGTAQHRRRGGFRRGYPHLSSPRRRACPVSERVKPHRACRLGVGAPAREDPEYVRRAHRLIDSRSCRRETALPARCRSR